VFPAAEKEMVRAMLSESIRAVISQTLLKTKDGSGRVASHEIMIGTPGDPQPDPREQDRADVLGDPDRRQIRHADPRPELQELVQRNVIRWRRRAQGRQQGQLRRINGKHLKAGAAWNANKQPIHLRTCFARCSRSGARTLHHRRLSAGDEIDNKMTRCRRPRSPGSTRRC